jgi:hypothetical protein
MNMRVGITPGDIYVGQSSKMVGDVVEVTRVTPINVQFKRTGSSSRGSEQRYTLHHDAFRTRYAPRHVVLGRPAPKFPRRPAAPAVAAAPPAVRPPADIQVGDSWVCVTATSHGLPLTIVDVTPTEVTFRARATLRSEDVVSSLPIEAFRERFTPTALVGLRQEELKAEQARAAARQGVPQQSALPELAPARDADEQPEPAAEAAPVKRRGRGGHPPQAGTRLLDAARAVEIVKLFRAGEKVSDIAAAFDTSTPQVRAICTGRKFGADTVEARGLPADDTSWPALLPKAAPVDEPAAVAVEETSMIESPAEFERTVNYVTDRAMRRDFSERPWRGVLETSPDTLPEALAKGAPTVEIDQYAPIQTVAAADDLPNIRLRPRADIVSARRAEELAEALRLVLPFVGKPLPRFVSIDTAAIEKLLAERPAGGS